MSAMPNAVMSDEYRKEDFPERYERDSALATRFMPETEHGESITDKHFQIWYREFGVALGIGEKNCRDVFNAARAQIRELLP